MSTFVIVKEPAGNDVSLATVRRSQYSMMTWEKVTENENACILFLTRQNFRTFTQKYILFSLLSLGTEQSGAAKMITSITLVQSLIPLISLLLCLALYVVRHYVSPGTSWFIQFLVTVSFTFGFFGLALMPIDLSLTTSVDSR